MSLNSRAAPSSNFNLINWKIGLPADSSGSFSGTSFEIKNLAGFQDPKYFYTAANGAMTFRAPVEGATTSGSQYARSELREMNGSEKAAWSLSTGGTLSATLTVDHAPIKFNGTAGRVVVGQIHGQDEELVRLYWDNGKIYFVNDHAGSGNKETKFTFTDSAGAQPQVSLGERFSYKISAKGNDLQVTVVADGKTYLSTTHINSIWQKDSFYFKAGAYLGVNETQGTGYGQTSFYALSFNHNSTQSAHVVRGTTSKNILHGSEAADVFYSGYGNDVLTGGSGKDTFVFDTKLGTSKTDRIVNFDTIGDFNVAQDSIWLDNKVFTKLGGTGTTKNPAPLSKDFFVIGNHARDANDHLIYNKNTGVLSYDADGSGKGSAIEFAQIGKGLSLSYKDFFVI